MKILEIHERIKKQKKIKNENPYENYKKNENLRNASENHEKQ